MSAASLLYVFTEAPYSGASGIEGLDAAMIGASFEQQVSVLFMHNGVYQIHAQQDVSGSSLKEVTKPFRALADFGIGSIFVHDLSMLARGLTANELMIDVTTLSSAAIGKLIARQDRVFTF